MSRADDTPTRRKVLAGAAGLAGASVAALGVKTARDILVQPEAAVLAARQPTYDEGQLVDLLTRGIAEFPEVVAQARGGLVVLKPNLVEVHEGRPINTDSRLLAAAVEAFRHHGAAEVVVAEGPGHHRDTELITDLAGLPPLLREVGARFVDLNLAATTSVQLARDFSGLGSLELPQLVMGADLVVSVAKLKIHHWAGATLTMKNLFGVVPGAVYGWPKNPLHWAGIVPSILDLWDAVRPGFGIVDGVVGMEGDGPIMGTAVDSGVVFMGPSLSAVDAEAARFMGLAPDRTNFLAATARLGGTVHPARIERRGDVLVPMDFAVLDHLAHMKADPDGAILSAG